MDNKKLSAACANVLRIQMRRILTKNDSYKELEAIALAIYESAKTAAETEIELENSNT